MNSIEFCAQFGQLKEVFDDLQNLNNIIELQKQEINKLESIISKAGFKVTQTSEGVFELVKDEEYETPTGDYLNPIMYTEGMTVESGKWYTSEDENIWEAIKDGVPTGFDDTEYFDIITV